MFLCWLFFIFFTFYLEKDQCKSQDIDNRYFFYDNQKNDWLEMQPDEEFPETWVPDAKLKVLVHGLNSHPERTPFEVIENHYLFIVAKEYENLHSKYNTPVNIMVVDWTRLSTAVPLEYRKAATGSFSAGVKIAEFLIKLKEDGHITDWKKVHIIGHSLGAHTSGVAGFKILNMENGEKVGRITGLDPAGPGFSASNPSKVLDWTKILDYNDADFVDIVHTNMGPARELFWTSALIYGTYGSDLASGHVDFIINGGSHMPECGDIKDRAHLCSHQISVLYYAFALRHHEQTSWTGGCPCQNALSYNLGLCPCKYPGTAELLGEWTNSEKPEPRRLIFMHMKQPDISKHYFD